MDSWDAVGPVETTLERFSLDLSSASDEEVEKRAGRGGSVGAICTPVPEGGSKLEEALEGVSPKKDTESKGDKVLRKAVCALRRIRSVARKVKAKTCGRDECPNKAMCLVEDTIEYYDGEVLVEEGHTPATTEEGGANHINECVLGPEAGEWLARFNNKEGWFDMGLYMKEMCGGKNPMTSQDAQALLGQYQADISGQMSRQRLLEWRKYGVKPSELRPCGGPKKHPGQRPLKSAEDEVLPAKVRREEAIARGEACRVFDGSVEGAWDAEFNSWLIA